MEIYNRMEASSIKIKGDGSPLTEADLASHNYIVSQLEQLPEQYPILSEENDQTVPYEQRKSWERFWCVDPLDGTKDFVQKNGEFVVNISLIEGNTPILGLVHVPVRGVTYIAERGNGAFLYSSNEFHPITVSPVHNTVKVVMSRNHCNEETRKLVGKIGLVHEEAVIEAVNVGSALKFLLVAEGSAHYYPRMVPTMEWDTAAPQIIVEEAGGKLISLETGAPLTYNKECLRNPFIFTGIDLEPLN